MPAAMLPPFVSFVRPNFHIGGSVSSVLGSARLWRRFADRAIESAGLLRAVNDGGFEGTEGDRYRELVNAEFPQHLTVAGDAHAGLADALEAYAFALGERTSEMDVLREKARVDHTNVNLATVKVNEAEAAVALAPDPATKSAAALALTAANAHLAVMTGVWESDLVSAETIKSTLGGQVAAQVQEIAAQARKSFAENPNFLQSWAQSASDFVDKHAEKLLNISEALMIAGGILAFIPGLNVVGGIFFASGLLLNGVLAANGNINLGEFLFNAATALPLGAAFRVARAGKLGAPVGAAANKLGNAAGKLGSSVSNTASRSVDGIRKALDPVDIATGAMIDNDIDAVIAGVVPLVVDRHAFSSHEVGRALGPRWVSSMDVRIEVSPDGVTMLCPDGALIQFPPAPLDGSEVRATGRGWLLSYGDGSYRVRAIDQGMTYTFAVYDPSEELTEPHGKHAKPQGKHAEPQGEHAESLGVGVVDTPPSVGRSMVGVGVDGNSVAGQFGEPVEIGISSMVHHTGHRVDYMWDNASGRMTAMVRSDGTRLDFTWDRVVNRVDGVWVSNPVTNPDAAPTRLVSYGYDPFGRLTRVINSHDGVLRYHYDDQGRPCGWTDRCGVSYHYRFDAHGRVSSQVGTGGVLPNVAVWLTDEGDDAPEGGIIAVAIETATPFNGDPLKIGDSVVEDYLDRLDALPLVAALREHGLAGAGLTGRGRTNARATDTDTGNIDTTNGATDADGGAGWSVPEQWLHDEMLGDIRPTVYRSTPAGDVWRIITPQGTVTDFEHNSYHQITAVTDTAGATTRTAYNDDGVVISQEYPDGTQSHVEPGSWATPVRIVGRDGHATECEVDAFGMVTAVTDPTGVRTTVEYEVRPTGIVATAVTDADGATTRVECDNAGRELAVVDPAGRRTSYTRDVRGLVTAVMDPVGETTSIDYTPEGWPRQVTHPDGTTVVATYDGEGNQLSVTNEVGATTTTDYTVFDKPIATTDAAGATTRIVYNTQMQPVALTNADNNTWTYEYDLDGVLCREVDYNQITTRTSTTADGLVSTLTTPAGVTTMTRNMVGLVENIVDGSGVTTYAYDELGRLLTIANADTTVSYTRDEYGRVTDEIVTLASGESTTSGVLLTPNGDVDAHHITLADGQRVTTNFDYNEVGEIASSTITHSHIKGARSTAGAHSASAFGSDVAVTLADLTYGRGSRGERNRMSVGSLVRTFDHDARGRLTGDHTGVLDASPTPEDQRGGVAGLRRVAGRDFTWRADTTLTGIVDQLRGATTFDVDKLGRVTQLRRDATQRTQHQSGQAQPAQHQGASAVESYGFSPAGVLTALDTPTSATTSGSGVGGREDMHPQTSHTTRPTGSSGGDAGVEFVGTMPTRVGRTSFVYDAAGRVIRTVTKRVSRKPLVRSFYYATGAQPIGFDSSDQPGVGYRYVYDGFGRRVAKETIDTATGNVTSRVVFVHAGNQLVAEHTTVGADRGRGFVWTTDPETGEIIGQITLTPQTSSTGGRHRGGDYPHGDAPRADVSSWSQDEVDAEFFAIVTDLAGAPHEIIHPDTGNIVGTASQTLYGQRTWRGEQSSPLLFAGQYADDESGWAYNRFRYYNPHAGIYNAQDPLGAPPRLASAQGYVDHAAFWIDVYGLKSCEPTWNEKRGIWEGADKATSLNAQALRADGIANKMEPLYPGDQAHHMVPARLNTGKWEECREVLDKHNVSPNSYVNLEYLPNEFGDIAGDSRLGHHGSGVHSIFESESFFKYINPSKNKSDLIERLSKIRTFHQDGGLLSDIFPPEMK